MALLNFDASQVDPSAIFDPLPPGKYLAEITDSEMKPTKAGNGEMLQLELTVIDGEFKNRKIWDRLCLRHPNPEAVKIAQANLSAICHAVDVLRPGDSIELHHIPLVIAVKCKIDESTGEVYNEVKSYAKPESQVRQTTPPKATTSATVNNTVPPWKR
jgi:hypothetical protein